MHSPAANAAEKQVPAPKVLAEPAVPEQVPAVSNESPIQTPSISGIAAQPSPAPKQTIESDVWTIADALWDRARHTEATAPWRRNSLFGEFSSRSIVEDCNLGSLRDQCCTQRIFMAW